MSTTNEIDIHRKKERSEHLRLLLLAIGLVITGAGIMHYRSMDKLIIDNIVIYGPVKSLWLSNLIICYGIGILLCISGLIYILSFRYFTYKVTGKFGVIKQLNRQTTIISGLLLLVSALLYMGGQYFENQMLLHTQSINAWAFSYLKNGFISSLTWLLTYCIHAFVPVFILSFLYQMIKMPFELIKQSQAY